MPERHRCRRTDASGNSASAMLWLSTYIKGHAAHDPGSPRYDQELSKISQAFVKTKVLSKEKIAESKRRRTATSLSAARLSPPGCDSCAADSSIGGLPLPQRGVLATARGRDDGVMVAEIRESGLCGREGGSTVATSTERQKETARSCARRFTKARGCTARWQGHATTSRSPK
jgi:hypothetical protein